MADEYPKRAADLVKARKIVEKRKPFVGNVGTLEPNIAEAVADGIELGRQEGIAMAVKVVSALKGATDG
jgi:hypothetical protein